MGDDVSVTSGRRTGDLEKPPVSASGEARTAPGERGGLTGAGQPAPSPYEVKFVSELEGLIANYAPPAADEEVVQIPNGWQKYYEEVLSVSIKLLEKLIFPFNLFARSAQPTIAPPLARLIIL